MEIEKRSARDAALARVKRPFLSTWLSQLKASTVDAYRKDLRHFQKYLGVGDLDAAAVTLVGGTRGEANELVRGYMAFMLESELAPATINRRLSALRSMVNVAEEIGRIEWTLKIKGVKTTPYRDTRGPGVEAIQSMFAYLEERGDDKAVRDRACLRLLFDCGLRRFEVEQLDLDDVDLQRKRIRFLEKGAREPRWLSVTDAVRDALRAWIDVRGNDAGPLLTSYSRAFDGDGELHRLSAHGIWKIVRTTAAKVGVETTPHALRHTAITAALDATGGDVRRVQKFSRHKNVQTVMHYDDAREDVQGEVAELVSRQIQVDTEEAPE